VRDLQELPKLTDSLSYLYAEHCLVEKRQQAIELFDQDGATLVPTAALTVLLLGPGTRITHAAVKTLADSGCSIVWVGEEGTRCYAHGGGETRKGYHLLHQARLASDPQLRLEVCKRMYRMRFDEVLDSALTIQQLRGMEGARVRTAYAQLSIRHNVPWHGRSYDRKSWGNSDPINRAISAANALMNGLCHAAIVSGGYSPGLGFIHTGKQLSFVYDVADLYKVDITIPMAFRIAGESPQRVESRVREACRQAFREGKLLQRILPDIEHLLEIPTEVLDAGAEADSDPGLPEPLWTPPDQTVASLAGPAESTALHRRRGRAEAGLKSGWVVAPVEPGIWHVITRPDSAGYTIRQGESGPECECPDFAKNGLGACKHTIAVNLVAELSETTERHSVGGVLDDGGVP
jgi:CRISP-associated protein Cas1